MAGEPLPDSRSVGSYLPHCLIPFLSFSPFAPCPTPQPPIWATVAVQCFWRFLHFPKWAHFKILYKLPLLIFPNNSPKHSGSSWEQLCALLPYKRLIWIMSVPEPLYCRCVQGKYCCKWNHLLHSCTKAQKQWIVYKKSYLLNNPPVKWSASDLVAFEDHLFSHSQ